jgi:hypothetical protein
LRATARSRVLQHGQPRGGWRVMRIKPAFLFDLDGTWSTASTSMAWREALDEEGIELPIWRIHRKRSVGNE